MLAQRIIQEIEKNKIDSAFIMMYFYDQIVIGKYYNDQLKFAIETPQLHESEYCFDDELCFEIHIFNTQKEIRWRKETDVFCIIEDPEKGEFFSEEMFILGTKKTMKIENGCTRLEQYGRVVCVPWEVEKKNNPLKLVVHHLFDAKKAIITGYRLVDIKGGML